jgi:hypothetical protein
LDLAEVRRIALALPEVEEYEHGDLPAFRVRGNASRASSTRTAST